MLAKASNNMISVIENIREKLKVFEEDREKSFVDWKFAEYEKCSKSEVKKIIKK